AVSMGTGPAGVAVVGGRRCGEGLALRWCISAALCAAFLGLGTSIAVLGPTFQNLADNVHKNVTDIYYIFVGRSLGYLGGSVVGGILFDHVNAHLLLGECVWKYAAGLLPTCGSVWVLSSVGAVVSGHDGFLYTCGFPPALSPVLAQRGRGAARSGAHPLPNPSPPSPPSPHPSLPLSEWIQTTPSTELYSRGLF
uniref:Major facilitator superfamily domain containing 4B n=1 Tax=Pavo cristatus TaxID=9049 RepID=A0A8C9F3B1_PAVCR